MRVDRAAQAEAAGKWEVLETILAERGWRRSDITPEAVALAAGFRQNVSRYDVPLPLDDEAEGDE